jgi:ferric-dicitrate binding protein FerR (iron transport regulator)
MTDPRYARLATALLARQPRPALGDSLGDRAATVHAVEQALLGRARRRIWRNVGATAAAAAVLVFAWSWALREPPRPVAHRPAPVAPAELTAVGQTVHGEGATLLRGQTTQALRHRVSLRAGDKLRGRRAADVLVSLSTGTQLGLLGLGELALVELGSVQKFALSNGHLRANVAKLESGQRFLISTNDSEIEVKGTSFEVTALDHPACADGTRTRVQVFDGVVTVRRPGGREVHVTAGSSWPPDCQAAAEPVAEPPVRSHRALRVHRSVAAAPVVMAAPPPAPLFSPSTLAIQNDLFAEALQAHRDGDTTRAMRRLDELLTRFPGGPLSESAYDERRKLHAEAAHRRSR